MLKPGEVIETAIWMDGTETQDMIGQFETDLRQALAYMAEAEGVMIGPLIMETKKPGEERVPKVPDTIQGPDVRLLVGTATVIDYAPVYEGNFVAELDAKDLERLRAIARKAFRKLNPDKPELSTERCDEFINQNGPEIALKALRMH